MRLTLGFGLLLLPMILACGGASAPTPEPTTPAPSTALADLDAAISSLDKALTDAEAVDAQTLPGGRLSDAKDKLGKVRDGLQPLAAP